MALLPAHLADQAFDAPECLTPNKYHSSTNNKSSNNSDNMVMNSKIVRVGIVGIVILVEKPKTWIPNQNALKRQP